jgi:hypothetical protein
MLPFGVTILGTVPQRSEIPEELMIYPVFYITNIGNTIFEHRFIIYKRTESV